MYLEHFWSVLLHNTNTLSYLADWVADKIHENSADTKCEHFTIGAEHTFSHHKDTKNVGESQMCEVWGQTDSFCALSAYFKAQGRASVNIYRQISGDVIRILTGDFKTLQLSVAPRICDYERELGMLSSGVANVLFFADLEKREALAKFGFAALDFIYVTPMKTASRVYEAIVEIIQLSAENKRFDIKFVSQTFKSTLIDGIKISVDNLHLALRAAADFFDTFSKGSSPRPGQIFRTVDKAITQVEGVLTNAALDLVAEITELITGFVSLLSGGEFPGGVVGLLKRVSKIAVDVAALVAEDFMLYINIVFNLLGSFGGVLKTMTTDVCNVVKDIMDIGIVQAIVGKPSFKCFDNGRRLTFRGRNLESVETHVVQWAREYLMWDGQTLCDKFIRNNDIAHHELSALEQATFENCLQLRLIGEQVAAAVDIPELKLYDAFYNWQRKYTVIYSIAQTITTTRKAESRAHAYNLFRDNNMNTTLHMAIYDKLNSFNANLWTSVQHASSIYIKEQNYSAPVFNNIFNIINDVQQTWAQDLAALQTGFNDLATNDELNAVFNTETLTTARVLKEVFNNKKKEATKIARKLTARAPLNVGISECDGESCLHCTLLDNTIDVVITHSRALKTFYESSYQHLINDVEAYGKGVVSFEEHLFASETAQASLNAAQISRYEFVQEDWQKLFHSATHSWRQNDTEFVIDGVAKLLTHVNDSYVPLFGYGIPFVVTYPVFESCDVESMIFVNHADNSNINVRLNSISRALVYVTLYNTAILNHNWLSAVPLSPFTGLLPLITADLFIYSYTVYGYLPTCVPLVPYTFMDDIWHYTQSLHAPSDFKDYFKTLSTKDEYRECSAELENFTILWPFITFLRDNSINIADFIPSFNDKKISDEIQKLRLGVELSQLEKECLIVNSASVPVTITAVISAVYVILRMVPTLLFTAFNFIVSSFMLYNTTQNMLEELLDEEEEEEQKKITAVPNEQGLNETSSLLLKFD